MVSGRVASTTYQLNVRVAPFALRLVLAVGEPAPAQLGTNGVGSGEWGVEGGCGLEPVWERMVVVVVVGWVLLPRGA